MLKNNELIEEFKRSLSATIKSIGKNDEIEAQEPDDIETLEDFIPEESSS